MGRHNSEIDMNFTLDDVMALEALDKKLRAILPEQYQYSYDDVLPVSMGSAGLKFDDDGRVAWNKIWATFCDLAMAGGPPHRGTLLEPASEETVSAAPENYRRVADEIRRGVSLVTGLAALEDSTDIPGWIGIQCRGVGMSGWLVRAIVMENVLARHDAKILYLPAGPEFRLEREIKNVITTVAKACHYWNEHMPADQQEAIQRMFENASIDMELLEPASFPEVQNDPDSYRQAVGTLSREITERTGKACFPNRYVGWIGVECPDVRFAIGLMRAMVVENVLVRREESVLFLPVSARFAQGGRAERLLGALERMNRLQAVRRA